MPKMNIIESPEAEEGLKYVPDGKYHFSAKRMAFLLKTVPDKHDFENAYETLKLKEVRELYGINLDDIYILMNHYHIPYKQPGGAKSYAYHTREDKDKPVRRDLSEFSEPKASKAPKAKATALSANQQNVNITMPDIDYDKLAEKIVYHMARSILKGYING